MTAGPGGFRRDFLRRTCAAAAALLPSRLRAEAEAPFDPAAFLTVQRGDLPVILSAPHGGTRAIPGVPERTGEGQRPGPAGFVITRDSHTERLAPALAAALEKRLGRRPYLVIADAHRRFMDANRPPEIAVEHARARAVYDAYRGKLAEFCGEARKRFGGGLLLDIHGQARAREIVFRGTHNGATMAALVKRHGPEVHAGPRSLAGLLAAHGVRIEPTDDQPEAPGFTGGHIVRTYGRFEGIGAVQLEFGMDFRDPDRIPAVAEQAAAGIAAFLREHPLDKPAAAP